MARHYHRHKSHSTEDAGILLVILAVLGWFYWRSLWALVKPGLPWILGVVLIVVVLGMVVIAVRRQGQHRHNQVTVCQAKLYQENVGIAGVQEVIGAREYYHADSAMVVTTANYTKAAKALAQEAHVMLWSREELAAAVAATKTKEEKIHE